MSAHAPGTPTTTEAAAHWHLLQREGALSPADQQRFMDWLVASPLHLREYLAMARVAAELGDERRALGRARLENIAARGAHGVHLAHVEQPVLGADRELGAGPQRSAFLSAFLPAFFSAFFNSLFKESIRLLSFKNSLNASAVVAKPSGILIPSGPNSWIISPNEAFLPPTIAISLFRISLKGMAYLMVRLFKLVY